MPFEIFNTESGKFAFRLKAANGQIILASQSYEGRSGAETGVVSVIENAQEANFEKLTAKDGSPYFNLKAGNGQIIGKSEMYTSESARDNGIESVIKNAKENVINDLT